ncbi:MAG: serine hydrolase domain-containing protein [Bacteroidota bacterium]
MIKIVWSLSLVMILALVFSCKSDVKRNEPKDEGKPLSNNNKQILKKLDSLVQILVDNKETPGVAYGIQIDGMEPVFGSYGFSNLESDKSMSVDDQFRIASITKPFTAISIFQLIESEKLSLDDTLDYFFPDFPRGEKITIYHLLSHTSGMVNWYDTKMPQDTPEDFPMCAQPHKYVEEMENMFLFEPGDFHSYSNTGYVLLGEIVEIISGKSFERYLKDEIFNPLQIIDSEMETLANSSEQWAKGYGLDRGVKELFVEPEKYPMPYAAGGLRSTVKDLLLLMKGLNDGTLLSKELRDKMTQYAKVNSGEDINDIVNFYFPKDFVLPERPEYLGKYGYGLGFQRMEIFSTDAIWHGGGIAGFQTALIHIPDNGVTLSILTNAGIPGGYSTIWKEVQCLITAIE